MIKNINPFLSKDFHIKWSNLKSDCIESDIRKSIEESKKNIDNLSKEFDNNSLNFKNTILELESATESLSESWGLVQHLDSVLNSKELREAYNKMLPEVTEFFSSITLNEKLWERIKAYLESNEVNNLTNIQKRFLNETVKDFIKSGANLTIEDKTKLKYVMSSLAVASHKFSENVLDSTNSWTLVINDKSRLKGVPESVISLLKKEAQEKGFIKKEEDSDIYCISLKAPIYMPILEYAEDESLRKEVWEASVSIGNNDTNNNNDLIWEIIKLRNEKAEILGKESFPELILEERMIKNERSANEFIDDLTKRTIPFFKKEIEELTDFRKKRDKSWKGKFQPWDFSYWAEKMRKENYDFSPEEMRPYFEITNVLEGMFNLTEMIFGIKIKEKETVYIDPKSEGNKDYINYDKSNKVEVWNEYVKFYEIYDKSTEEHLGSFYSDLYPRENKRGGAWMNYFRTGLPGNEFTSRKPHLGLICANLTPPSDDNPSLLNLREVETIFHEFGHLLHHILGDVSIKSLNGINVVWDFVELPSQFMENFCWSRVSLDIFAKHYKTNESIPDKLFEKMLRARNFHSAIFQMRQLSLGKMDLVMHSKEFMKLNKNTLDEVLEDILSDYKIDMSTKSPTIARRFTHLFASPVGYSSGYYSYKWAEVLEADIFSKFLENGVINSDIGLEFREKVLSKGNSKDAESLFIDFMGRKPESKPLMKRLDLISN